MDADVAGEFQALRDMVTAAQSQQNQWRQNGLESILNQHAVSYAFGTAKNARSTSPVGDSTSSVSYGQILVVPTNAITRLGLEKQFVPGSLPNSKIQETMGFGLGSTTPTYEIFASNGVSGQAAFLDLIGGPNPSATLKAGSNGVTLQVSDSGVSISGTGNLLSVSEFICPKIEFGTTASFATGYITSTSNATKGKYFLNSAGTISVDELNTRIGVGVVSPVTPMDVAGIIQGGSSTQRAIIGGGIQTAGEAGIYMDFGNLVANRGRIQAESQGVAYRRLEINPSGGDVAIALAGNAVIGGAGQTVGFYNSAGAGVRTQGSNVANNVASGGTANQLDNWTSLAVYATDANAIRNAVYQLGVLMTNVIGCLRGVNLMT